MSTAQDRALAASDALWRAMLADIARRAAQREQAGRVLRAAGKGASATPAPSAAVLHGRLGVVEAGEPVHARQQRRPRRLPPARPRNRVARRRTYRQRT